MVQDRPEREPSPGGCQRADFSTAVTDAWEPSLTPGNCPIKITATQSVSIEIDPVELAKVYAGLDPNDVAPKMLSNEEIIALYKRRDFDLRSDLGFIGGGDKTVDAESVKQQDLYDQCLRTGLAGSVQQSMSRPDVIVKAIT